MRSPAPSARSIVGMAIAAVLTAWLVGSVAAQAAASYTASSYAARLLELVNGARQAHGLRPLTVASGTASVAAGWTQHLADSRALSHNPALARQLETHGSADWRTYGENVGTGAADDPDGLFNAYMQSPEHRANILHSDYRYVGVAVVLTGARAWNTFDFVDVYRTAPVRHVTRRPAHPALIRKHTTAAAVSTHSVAPSAATVSTPPVRPSHRAARPAGPVVVHVEALRHRAALRPVAALWTNRVSAAPTVAVLPTGKTPAPRRHLIAIAAAVLALAFGGRRWLLAAGGHA